MRYVLFLGIAVFGVIFFLVAIMLSVLAFWSENEKSSLMLCVYAAVHVTFILIGAAQHGLARRSIAPTALAAATFFGYNRRWVAQPDISPFSDGIGTVDQHVYGVLAWFRKFDQPYSEFGNSYVDCTAFALNAELVVVFFVILTAALHCWDALKCLTLHKRF